jgi:hypothetical protein
MPDQLIPERIRSLLDLYNAVETTDEQREHLEQELEELELSFAQLLEQLEIDIVETNADIEYWKEWLTAKAKRAKMRMDSTEQYIIRLMKRKGIQKTKAGIFSSLRLQDSEYVYIENDKLLGREYLTPHTTYSANKLKITKAIRDGKTVSGAELKQRTNLIVK